MDFNKKIKQLKEDNYKEIFKEANKIFPVGSWIKRKDDSNPEIYKIKGFEIDYGEYYGLIVKIWNGLDSHIGYIQSEFELYHPENEKQLNQIFKRYLKLKRINQFNEDSLVFFTQNNIVLQIKFHGEKDQYFQLTMKGFDDMIEYYKKWLVDWKV